MRPIDYRNETFEALLARGLVSERLAVCSKRFANTVPGPRAKSRSDRESTF